MWKLQECIDEMIFFRCYSKFVYRRAKEGIHKFSNKKSGHSDNGNFIILVFKSKVGWKQHIPPALTFGDCHAIEIPDSLSELEHLPNDSSYSASSTSS